MQILLGVALFIVCVNSAVLRSKRWDELEDFNKIRKDLGMQPLQFSSIHLRNKKDMPCEGLKNGPDERVFAAGLNDNSNKDFALLFIYIRSLSDPTRYPEIDPTKARAAIDTILSGTSHFYWLEAFVAGQTTVGCIPKTCETTFDSDTWGPLAHYFNGNVMSLSRICVVAPVGATGVTMEDLQKMEPQFDAIAKQCGIDLTSVETAMKAGAQSL